MSHHAWRRWGMPFLAVWLAAPAMMAPAAGAAPAPSAGAVTHSASHTRTAAHVTRRHRRHGRRLPPGGVVWARHAIVLDPATDEVLFDKNSGSAAPCASLTKLMSTMVFLDQKPNLERQVDVTNAEIRGGGHTQLRRGEQVKLGDLLHMSLMCSDNVATRVLARESGIAPDSFTIRMNSRAADLGLAGTSFVEPTGLDERNVSTAADIARLLRAAAANDLVSEITTTRGYEFRSLSARGRVRIHHISNTDRLLYGRYDVRGGKTGFIQESGYCLATWIRTGGRDMIAVVLGAPTKATRFADVVRLVQHTATPTTAPSGL